MAGYCIEIGTTREKSGWRIGTDRIVSDSTKLLLLKPLQRLRSSPRRSLKNCVRPNVLFVKRLLSIRMLYVPIAIITTASLVGMYG
jgi:hypothetical protein